MCACWYVNFAIPFYSQNAAFIWHASTVIERQLASLLDWLKKWRVAINTDKSVAVCFTRKSTSKFQSLSVELPRFWDPMVLIGEDLGVQLYRRLNFNEHVTQTLNMARGVRAKIFPMLSWNSHLAVRIKVILYLLFLRSVLPDAAFASWPNLSATQNVGWNPARSGIFRNIPCQKQRFQTGSSNPILGRFHLVIGSFTVRQVRGFFLPAHRYAR